MIKLLIKLYRLLLKPILFVFALPHSYGACCRFVPSCSQYTVLCFENFNFIKAFYLSIKRLLSCHPWKKNRFVFDFPGERKMKV